MKKIIFAAVAAFAMVVLIMTITTMWDVCKPMAIVLIILAIVKLFKREEKSREVLKVQMFLFPLDIYIAYLLWPAHTGLAISYIVAVILCFLMVCAIGAAEEEEGE